MTGWWPTCWKDANNIAQWYFTLLFSIFTEHHFEQRTFYYGWKNRDILCCFDWIPSDCYPHWISFGYRSLNPFTIHSNIRNEFNFFQRTFSNSQWTPTGFALDYSLVFLCKVFKEQKFSGKLLISCGIKKFNKRKKNTITVAFAAAEAKSCVGWKERSVNFENI